MRFDSFAAVSQPQNITRHCGDSKDGRKVRPPYYGSRVKRNNKHHYSFTNFFGGSPLNRLSWLRSSHSFLNALVVSPSTRWILFNAGQPLIERHPDSQSRSLALFPTKDIRRFLGPEPFFGQSKEDGEVAPGDIVALEASRLRGSPIVFLGLHEPPNEDNALSSSQFKDAPNAVANIRGTAYFALDVQALDQQVIDETLNSSQLARDGPTLQFVEWRAAIGTLDDFTATIFATGRSLLDWVQRNKAGGPPSHQAYSAHCCQKNK
jgi:NAD+ diphosphatase